MFYGRTTYMLSYNDENYIIYNINFFFLLYNNSNQINIILTFYIHSSDLLIRIGFENVRILKDIRLGQLHRRCNANSSSIPQAMQIGSIRPMLCRYLFNGQCLVMIPTKIFVNDFLNF
jgi:hypothetical protein